MSHGFVRGFFDRLRTQGLAQADASAETSVWYKPVASKRKKPHQVMQLL
ncbi:hypothetical protein O9853_04165 [Vibrio lentus]|nr:hypothetical protein [Vibrio lentus]